MAELLLQDETVVAERDGVEVVPQAPWLQTLRLLRSSTSCVRHRSVALDQA